MFKEVFEKLAFFVLRVKRVEIFKAHLRVKKACSHSFSFKDMFESWEQRHSQRWTDDKEVWWITDFVRNKGHKWRLYRVVSFLLDELIKATWTWKRLQTKQMVLVFKKRDSLAIAANFFGSHLSAPTCHPNFHLLFLSFPSLSPPILPSLSLLHLPCLFSHCKVNALMKYPESDSESIGSALKKCPV